MIELLFGLLLSESSVNEHEQPKNATAQVIKQTKAVLYIFKESSQFYFKLFIPYTEYGSSQN
jgi:hypothetical protein